MYLNKLEIHGFKSFGDAVKLNIPQGITAVIGPNGSGKSNVADAIRWVLGEQSAKTLRGTKMEDIIFAGTEKRKSLGYAEVTMSITNDDRKLAIDYGEVNVKRRVYRSGESEYFINNKACRLKDIQEIFMDTGVGKEGYSIIGQGQIDKILSSKPEDRRSLFEEAAGIYKYKVRRHEAERKLERERENLVRIDDIMTEIETRLEPLEKEAEKTKHYLSLKDHLKDYEINVFIQEVTRIKEELEKLTHTIQDVKNQYNQVSKQKQETEKAYQEAKHGRDALYSKLEQLLLEITNLEKAKQQKESEILLSEERIKSIESLEEQIQKDTQKQSDYKQEMQSEKQVLQSKMTALELEKATQETLIQKAETELNTQSTEVTKANQNLEGSKSVIYDKVRQIDLLKSQIDNQNTLEEQMEYREIQVKENIQRLNSEVAHQEVQLKVLEKKEEENRQTYGVKKEDFHQQGEQRETLSKQIEGTQKEINELGQKSVQTERQIKWLEQIRNDHEGYFQSVKQVLQVKKTQPGQWQGILGVIAELIEVPEKYELAMVTALGGAMQNIVVEAEKDAKAMIHTMKQRGIGRVTFLPLDTMQAYGELVDIGSLKKENGFLGLGNELIAYDEKYAVIVKNLLGRILIVDTIDHASQIARKYRYKYKIVTLEGDVFNAGGSLSGGSAKNNKNNMFARTRELKELQEKYQKLCATVDGLMPQLEKLKSQYTQVDESWSTLKGEIETLENAHKQLQLESSKCTSSLELTKNSQLQLVEEKLKIQEIREKSQDDKTKILEEIENLQEVVEEDKEMLKHLEVEIEALKVQQDEARNTLTEKKIEYSKTLENTKYVISQIKLLEEKIELTKEQHESIVSRQEALVEDKSKIREDIEGLRQEILAIEEKHAKGQTEKSGYEVRKIELEEAENDAQEEIRRLEESAQNVKEEIYRLEHKKEFLELENTKQNDLIWEQYELSYTACLPFQKDLGELSAMRKETDRLRAQIKTIGNINVNAIVEYDETKTRYEFLSEQRMDIEKAEKTLIEMIDTLTKQMHEIFREQFQLIATNFSQVFKELFGGGMAFLQLVDEENILESGIEIIAKPPGKKLQNMTLLSGGERTLTAIALLFGILQLKPSPFCVLDEIEAALDDANVLRFAQYLGSLSQETQFVIITHRKGTMEAADTLYGVTMQERGVSTVLSIKLEEATQYLDKKLG